MKLDHDLPFTMSHLTERFLSTEPTESPLFHLGQEKYNGSGEVSIRESNGSEMDGEEDDVDEDNDDDDDDDNGDGDYESEGSKLSGLEIGSTA